MTSITRISRSGQNYQFPATNATDGDPATSVDLYATNSSAVSDYLRVDFGAPTQFRKVVIRNASLPLAPNNGCEVTVEASLNPSAGANDSFTGSNGAVLIGVTATNAPFSGQDLTVTSCPSIVTAQYLLISMNCQGGSQMGTLGEVQFPAPAATDCPSPAPPPAPPPAPIPIPVLTAAGDLVSGVPSILLSVH